MSLTGRPEGEYRSAQHEGSPVRARAAPGANAGAPGTTGIPIPFVLRQVLR